MEEPKVAQDVAEAEFDKFADAMDLDVSPDGMNEESLESFQGLKRQVIRAIMKGSLIFNDDGEAIYTPRHRNSKFQEPITFHERSGAHLTEMDKAKKRGAVAQTYAVMGAMTGQSASVFAGLVGPDIKTCEALYALLMMG